MDGNLVLLCELHRTDLQNFRPHGGHFKHLFVCDAVKLAGRGTHVGVSRVNAIDVRKNFALAGIKRCGQSDGRRIRASTPKRGDASVLGDALETGDNDNIV